MNPLIQSKNTTILPVLIALTLGCFGLSPTARAIDPPPDGGYPNFNTAEGEDALFSLTTGDNNTAVGFDALFSDSTGGRNTAVGSNALQHNTKGVANTAIGLDAMKSNSTGKANVAVGVDALIDNTAGFRNNAFGTESLKKTTGSDNIGLGYEAGMNVTTGRFTISIGNIGLASDSNMIRIGTDGIQTTTFIAGIKETPVVGTAVAITADGQLGVTASSARFKEAIQPMDKASEAILALHPVTFRYKKDLDPDAIPQFGLVAEDVAKVNPNLVARDNQGKPYTVRYEAVNAMVLNEFLKEHRKGQQQDATIGQLKSAVAQQQSTNAEQQKEIQALAAALKAQAAEIKKVSDQLRTQAPAPRVVAND